ncbi:gastrula zinc finger protein XlCGF67.1-like [Sinocyclocheilus grahami]|uniref:gastrula zinc finger protein XlCGF67.1-like n=1 Tax=Sinocyclocheilus grahami TaxID=75366 RepID=UPI0007ACB227|nr:PREDICTED: gastrula zinc finger protein XlCGF67.1-like [Sinocyclocheilus grahami]
MRNNPVPEAWKRSLWQKCTGVGLQTAVNDKEEEWQRNVCFPNKQETLQNTHLRDIPVETEFVEKLRELKEQKPSQEAGNAFVCPECGKSFTHKGHFNEHVKIHSGVESFSCPHCQKSFTCRGHLKRHIHIHTGERPYACDQCGKSFKCTTNLKDHQRSRTRENEPSDASSEGRASFWRPT